MLGPTSSRQRQISPKQTNLHQNEQDLPASGPPSHRKAVQEGSIGLSSANTIKGESYLENFQTDPYESSQNSLRYPLIDVATDGGPTRHDQLSDPSIERLESQSMGTSKKPESIPSTGDPSSWFPKNSSANSAALLTQTSVGIEGEQHNITQSTTKGPSAGVFEQTERTPSTENRRQAESSRPSHDPAAWFSRDPSKKTAASLALMPGYNKHIHHLMTPKPPHKQIPSGTNNILLDSKKISQQMESRLAPNADARPRIDSPADKVIICCASEISEPRAHGGPKNEELRHQTPGLPSVSRSSIITRESGKSDAPGTGHTEPSHSRQNIVGHSSPVEKQESFPLQQQRPRGFPGVVHPIAHQGRLQSDQNPLQRQAMQSNHQIQNSDEDWEKISGEKKRLRQTRSPYVPWQYSMEDKLRPVSSPANDSALQQTYAESIMQAENISYPANCEHPRQSAGRTKQHRRHANGSGFCRQSDGMASSAHSATSNSTRVVSPFRMRKIRTHARNDEPLLPHRRFGTTPEPSRSSTRQSIHSSITLRSHSRQRIQNSGASIQQDLTEKAQLHLIPALNQCIISQTEHLHSRVEEYRQTYKKREQEAIQELRSAKYQMSKQMKDMKRSLREAIREKQEMKAECSGFRKRLDHVFCDQNKLYAEANAMTKKAIDQMKAKEAQHKEEMEMLCRKSQDLRQTLAEASRRVLAEGDLKIKTLQERVTDLTQQLEDREAELNREKKALQAVESKAARAQSKEIVGKLERLEQKLLEQTTEVAETQKLELGALVKEVSALQDMMASQAQAIDSQLESQRNDVDLIRLNVHNLAKNQEKSSTVPQQVHKLLQNHFRDLMQHVNYLLPALLQQQQEEREELLASLQESSQQHAELLWAATEEIHGMKEVTAMVPVGIDRMESVVADVAAREEGFSQRSQTLLTEVKEALQDHDDLMRAQVELQNERESNLKARIEMELEKQSELDDLRQQVGMMHDTERRNFSTITSYKEGLAKEQAKAKRLERENAELRSKQRVAALGRAAQTGTEHVGELSKDAARRSAGALFAIRGEHTGSSHDMRGFQARAKGGGQTIEEKRALLLAARDMSEAKKESPFKSIMKKTIQDQSSDQALSGTTTEKAIKTVNFALVESDDSGPDEAEVVDSSNLTKRKRLDDEELLPTSAKRTKSTSANLSFAMTGSSESAQVEVNADEQQTSYCGSASTKDHSGRSPFFARIFRGMSYSN